jgi:hypothetical protein
MKIRKGFVSNSSSSSFIIASNLSIRETLEQEWENIFPARDTSTIAFMKELKNRSIEELLEWEREPITWSSFAQWNEAFLKDFRCSPRKEEMNTYTNLFNKWKYVHEISIPGDGDGGNFLLQALRDSFPKDYCGQNVEIMII